MEAKYKRGHKLYNDKAETEESAANPYFDCRDGVINSVEYRADSGYGALTQLLICHDTKHEAVAVIRRTHVLDRWVEDVMYFDRDSFEYFEALIKGDTKAIGGTFELLRTY